MRIVDSAPPNSDIARSATRRGDNSESQSRPLSSWGDFDAYVLLADPGGGKSRAFVFEAQATGGRYVKARDFANLGAPEGWHGETLFIDGFDEMRADATSRNTPLDTIVTRLGQLGRPRFRLSCREADWLLAVDQPTPRGAAPGGLLEVLYLDPLNDDEVVELLRRHADRVPDPRQFMDKARQLSLDAMLRNPLLLNLLVAAVGDQWPKSRAQIFKRACERMAGEHDQAIAAALGSRQPSVETILDTAGFICAVLLLSGTDTGAVGPNPIDPRSEMSAESLQSALEARPIDAALSSKLFVADDTRRVFRHRSIAEYLAARALGRRVTKKGLPMSRVAALMCAPDGGVVEPLRGLNAWLSVTCPMHRAWAPQVENYCRDRLFELLRPELIRYGVVLNKEAQHANDTRADLWVEAVVDGHLRVVPIEIKKEDHEKFWTAWHDQLDGSYTTHPDAEGVGIYLVLWFGHRPRSDPSVAVPGSAPEMQERLTALIPVADRTRLTVRILDLSVQAKAGACNRRAIKERK